MLSVITCVRFWLLKVVLAPGRPLGLVIGGGAVKISGALISLAEISNRDVVRRLCGCRRRRWTVAGCVRGGRSRYHGDCFDPRPQPTNAAIASVIVSGSATTSLG